MIDETLSSSTPPYASGTSVPSRPSSPHLRTSCARQRPVLLLEPLDRRHHLVGDELVRRLPNQAVLVGEHLGREEESAGADS